MPNSVPANIEFTPMAKAHLPILRAWLAADHVRPWWGDPDDELRLIVDGEASGESKGYIVTFDGRKIGYVQSWYPASVDTKNDLWINDLPEGSIGIDITIGEIDAVDKGFGTEIIKAFCTKLYDENALHLIIDPDPENIRAVRCYEKAGFVRDKLIETSDGPALLMHHDRRTVEQAA